MAAWLIPSLAYIAIVGSLGVTTKLALRTLRWQDLILWATIVYVAIAAVLLVLGGTRLRIDTGNGWALLSGVLAAGGLVVFYIALGHGPATRVVPVTAAYPLLTAALGALVLSERVTPLRVGGTLLIVAGVVLLTLQRS